MTFKDIPLNVTANLLFVQRLGGKGELLRLKVKTSEMIKHNYKRLHERHDLSNLKGFLIGRVKISHK